MNTHTRSGFTLIEIIIAVAIVGLMAALVGPGFFRYLTGSKVKTAQVSLRTFKNSINVFQMDVGQYPEQLKDLMKKPTNEDLARDWNGPYIEESKTALLDPWKNKYQYQVTPGAEHPYELYSYGASGKGAPRAEWISVWDL